MLPPKSKRELLLTSNLVLNGDMDEGWLDKGLVESTTKSDPSMKKHEGQPKRAIF